MLGVRPRGPPVSLAVVTRSSSFQLQLTDNRVTRELGTSGGWKQAPALF